MEFHDLGRTVLWITSGMRTLAARSRLVVLAIIVGLLLSVTAPALAIDISFTGAGWGHGVGLSQYGAKAMGADGATYDQILHRYFTGVSLVSVSTANPDSFVSTDPTPLRVGLLQDAEMVSFIVESGSALLCFDGADQCVGTAQPGNNYRFGLDEVGTCVFLRVAVDGESTGVGLPGSCDASVRPLSAETTINIPFKARSYRHGTLLYRVGPTRGKIHTVYEVGIDNYMKGLSEVPDLWPNPAIKAQVVVSRSLAVASAIERGGEGTFSSARRDDCSCNLRDDASDQVFRGWTGEASHPRWVAAVASTAQQVMVSGGSIVLGLYSSSSGGTTENYVDVFTEGNHPYLASVNDSPAFAASANNPHAIWSAGYDQASLAGIFGFSWLANAEVVERNDSGSARTVRLSGIVDGWPAELLYSGVYIRAVLSLRSTTFDIILNPRFEDVPVGHSFSGEVLGLHSLSITEGCTATEFCPEQPVTRAEMAAFLVRALNISVESSGTSPFTDIDGHYLEDEISALYRSGITSGCTATRFCPERAVTRAEMAAFLILGFEVASSSASPFTDIDGHYLEDEISALYRSGITSGCTATRFCPEQPVTRAEMAAFLIRALAI